MQGPAGDEGIAFLLYFVSNSWRSHPSPEVVHEGNTPLTSHGQSGWAMGLTMLMKPKPQQMNNNFHGPQVNQHRMIIHSPFSLL